MLQDLSTVNIAHEKFSPILREPCWIDRKTEEVKLVMLESKNWTDGPAEEGRGRCGNDNVVCNCGPHQSL